MMRINVTDYREDIKGGITEHNLFECMLTVNVFTYSHLFACCIS